MNVPSGYTELDLVGFTDRGDYSPIVEYVKNDLVNNGGNKWRCLKDSVINVPPVEGDTWTLFFQAGDVRSWNGRSGSILPIAGDYNAEQITYNQTSNVGAAIGELEEAVAGVASVRSDLTSINATGTINTTGSTITKGTYFYLNGDYVRAKADIANGATFTIGTNVEATTVGDGLKGNMYSGTSLATLNTLIAALTPSEYANSALGIGGQLYFPRDDAGSNTYRRYQYILLMASNPGIQYYVKTYDHTTSKLTQGQKNTDGSISSSDITSTMTSWNLYVK